MTMDDKPSGQNLERLNENIAKVEELSQRLVAALTQKKPTQPALQGPGQDVFVKAASAYMAEMMTNPAKVVEHQVSYWGKMLKHYVEAQHVLTSGRLTAPPDRTPDDRRFKNDLWETHPYFNFIKQNYLLTSEAISQAVSDLDGLEEADRRRVSYFTQQLIDMFSPANFLATNPEALERAVETDGQSLVDGLENLVRDIERTDGGDLLVTLADPKAFTVGENLATTEGAVVFRNDMFELIQYAPKTEKVHETPLIIFPPWINKFYILDLREKNSFIHWVVEQGYTLFVVSWKNPDPSYRDVGLDDYAQDGFLEAISQVKTLTGQKQVNAIGYCIAGTTLSMIMALMAKRGDTSIKSATLFTTLTDFTDQGEVGVFLDDNFIDGIEREVEKDGVLQAFFMSRTFTFLRSKDLVYQPAVRSYMMGESPPAFDLLYWNGDGTNLPARMAMEYLRGLCQENRFAKDGFKLLGETVKISDVKTQICAVACETDHIAAWKSSFDGVSQFSSRAKKFILSESGHIAGIVNPPSKKKYGHYTNADLKLDAEAWREAADFHEGSWWPTWEAWLKKKSGKQVNSREPGDSEHPTLADAPGSYVVEEPAV